jgi:hypothetical protein
MCIGVQKHVSNSLQKTLSAYSVPACHVQECCVGIPLDQKLLGDCQGDALGGGQQVDVGEQWGTEKYARLPLLQLCNGCLEFRHLVTILVLDFNHGAVWPFISVLCNIFHGCQ